jgi:hypothetical protein
MSAAVRTAGTRSRLSWLSLSHLRRLTAVNLQHHPGSDIPPAILSADTGQQASPRAHAAVT